MGRKRQRKKEGEKEGPLHEGHHAITRNKLPKSAQIKGETQAVQHKADKTERLGLLDSARRMRGIEDQQQHAEETDRDTQRFLPGDGFLDKEKGEKHREDRRQRMHDRCVNGCRNGHGLQESQLRHEKAHERSQRNQSDVFPGNRLLREEQRNEPEQRARPDGPERKEQHRRHRICIGDILREHDVQPEDRVRSGNC